MTCWAPVAADNGLDLPKPVVEACRALRSSTQSQADMGIWG